MLTYIATRVSSQVSFLLIRVFLNKAKGLPFLLIKEKSFLSLTTQRRDTCHAQSGNKSNYSRGIMLHKFLAPARHQSTISSLILAMSMVEVECWFWKTFAFLSFQTSQPTSIAKEAIAFLRGPLLWMASDHQSLTVWKVCHSSMAMLWSPSQILMDA